MTLMAGEVMKVAFVHDWLVTYRGGEKVLEALLELFPEAFDLYLVLRTVTDA